MPKTPATLPIALLLLATACVGVPEGIEPVRGFEADRYLGTWYEIARLDHRFERGLERVTASYALEGDTPADGLSVVNRGFDPEDGAWREVSGRARFAGDPATAHLEVSFFGPFYGSYVVFALDPGYRWAWVTGPDRGTLWLLAREPELPPARLEELLAIPREAGFATDDLIFVPQAPR